MKLRLLSLCCALLTVPALFAGTRPQTKILIEVAPLKKLGLENPERVVAQLEDLLQTRIGAEFPCTRIKTRHAILKSLDELRYLAWRGTATDPDPDYQKELTELGSQMAADHLVVLDVTPMGAQWIVNGKWLDARKARALARRMETAGADTGSLLDAVGRIAEKLVDDAAYFEICGYTGPVKITIHSTRSDNPREERPAACNNMKQTYIKTTSIGSTTDTALDLTRTDRSWATGTLEYASIETEDIEELDPCHQCTPQTWDLRYFTEHKRTETRITGLSEASSTREHRHTDVRVYLVFDRGGTFRLELESSSEMGTQHVKIDRKAEGQCDTDLKEPKVDERTRITIPFSHVFGPFDGSPRDRTLSAKRDFPIKDPVTKETTTISVEFNLSRD
ncbi:MAG TPA: hypothetical protein VK178_14575 [Opitutaceae bacterium]|nr:hypothetical protein [Opitutaceae bacterium]